MIEVNPWKTPFGRILIGSSIIAAVVGFSLAAGVTTYFRTEFAEPDDRGDVVALGADEGTSWSRVETPTSTQRDVVSDPEGYAEALAVLEPATEAQPPAVESVALGEDEAGSDDALLEDDPTTGAVEEVQDAALDVGE